MRAAGSHGQRAQSSVRAHPAAGIPAWSSVPALPPTPRPQQCPQSPHIQGGLGATAEAGQREEGWWSAGRAGQVQRGARRRENNPKNQLRKGGKGRTPGFGDGALPSRPQPARDRKGTVSGWLVEGWFCVTHDRKRIRCKRSRSCHPSARGRRHRCLWSCRPPCGSRHRPVCRRLAPGR